MIRELPPSVVVDWLENWAAWTRGSRPALGADVSEICAQYRSPESWHHEPPSVRIQRRIVAVDAGALVERLLRAPTFPARLRNAVVATYCTWPTDLLRRYHVRPAQWDGKRARAAGERIPQYQLSLHSAHIRLGRDLWPQQHLLPRAA